MDDLRATLTGADLVRGCVDAVRATEVHRRSTPTLPLADPLKLRSASRVSFTTGHPALAEPLDMRYALHAEPPFGCWRT
jgi:hypothetical protein